MVRPLKDNESCVREICSAPAADLRAGMLGELYFEEFGERQ